MTLLAVDIGGSGSRALLERDGAVLATATGPRLRVATGGITIADIVHTLASELPEQIPSVVSVGMSGLLGLTRGDRALGELRDRWPASRILLASDAVTSAAAALGTRGGATLAVGTGVIGLATDFDEVWRRADGWGHVLGDEGGGAWVGVHGLRAALREHDGRPGGSPVLLAAARDMFGSPEGLPARIYTREDRAGILAGFAPDVAAAARGGDPVAAAIWSEAAERLAETALALLDSQVPRRLAVVGGLLGASDLLLAPLRDRIAQDAPDVELVAPPVTPLDGSRILGRNLLGPEKALASHPPFLTISYPGLTHTTKEH